MKVTIYYPDGTNTSYEIGLGGVKAIIPNGGNTSVVIKYDTADLDKTISNFPMIITN